MNKTLWISLAAAVIIGSGIYISRGRPSEKAAMMKEKSAMPAKGGYRPAGQAGASGGENTESKMIPKEGAVMRKDEGSMQKKDEAIMKKEGAYKDYSPAALTEATKDNGKAVLFFHAAWCPFCKSANAAFLSKTNEIPAGVTVLKTDYDSNTDLKTKYGVVYQHTFVQVDAQGNQITKWNGGDIDELKKNLK